MSFLDILLIIISSAGLVHGISFAVYLTIFKKRKTLTNKLLGWILVFMAFRIGKSVMLNFGSDLEPVFIFVGLSFLLLIGPILKYYVLGMTSPGFKLPKYYILEFFPFLGIFIASLFVTKEWYENGKLVIIIFATGLIFIYLHFALYIAIAWSFLRQIKKEYLLGSQTKSQKAILKWLQLLLVGFVIIWVSYVLNILDETIPYIVGPILYSLIIYYLSYKAFVLKSTNLDGNVFKVKNDEPIFTEILRCIEKEMLYRNPDVSLAKLSKAIGRSPQLTSSVINQYSKRNFNDFINFYRIQEAKKLLSRVENNAYTISSIAFDTGFSSLSSFNSAFKKFEGVTPSIYRKSQI